MHQQYQSWLRHRKNLCWLGDSLYWATVRGLRAFIVNENDSASERPDADSLTGYIVTYKSILAAVTQHHFFKCQTCITLNKKKKSKESSSPDCMWNSKLKIISLPNPDYDKRKQVTSVVLTLVVWKTIGLFS